MSQNKEVGERRGWKRMKVDENIRSATCISDAIIPGQLISSTNTINDYLFSNMSVKNLNLCTEFPFQASDLFTPERFLIQPKRFQFSLFLLIRTWLISLIREDKKFYFHYLLVSLWLGCFSHLTALILDSCKGQFGFRRNNQMIWPQKSWYLCPNPKILMQILEELSVICLSRERR